MDKAAIPIKQMGVWAVDLGNVGRLYSPRGRKNVLVNVLYRKVARIFQSRRKQRLVDEVIRQILPKITVEALNSDSQPNFSEIRLALRNIEAINLTIKNYGYELGRALVSAMPMHQNTAARHVGLQTKLSTQADLETDWAAHWCRELQIPIILHRKMWEYVYVLQALYEEGHLREGARGLGFGCGGEPLPSYFTSNGINVTVTDLDEVRAAAQGWVHTHQHAANLDRAFHGHLTSREAFDRHADFRVVDMNAIPEDLHGYDFCWSICALEHIGSIEKGLAFIERSLDTLRPGGLSIHTTEFNVVREGPTVDNWGAVLFQARHFEALAERLRAQGHYVAELNFDPGDKPMDNFIDVPPWHHDLPEYRRRALGEPMFLKLSLDGFICTCVGIIIRKGG